MLLLCAPMTMMAQKIGFVDMDAVAQALPEFATAQKEIQDKAAAADKELQDMAKEIQRQLDDYQKQANTMPAAKRQATEKQLTDLNTKYEQTRQQKAQELQKLQQEKLQPIQTKVTNAINNVGNAGGFTFIALKDSMPFMSTTKMIDVTSQCKTEVLKLK